MDEKYTKLSSKLDFAEEFQPEQAPVIIMATLFRLPTYSEAVMCSATPSIVASPVIPAPIIPFTNPTDDVLAIQPPTNPMLSSDSPSHNESDQSLLPLGNLLPDTCDCWAIAQNGCVPPNAVQAGYESDESRNYVGRAYHNGEFLPGKYIPKDRCTYVLCEGNEVRKSNCEILIGTQFIWVPVTNNFALGAVEVDRNSNREHLYVGRADNNGSVASGKFQRSDNRLYLSSNGHGIQITNNIEILVRRDEYFRDKTNN